MVKKVIELHRRYRSLGIFYIVVVKGVIKLLTRKTKISSGWQAPIAYLITETVHNRSYRTISANDDNSLHKHTKNKPVKRLDEDIYPLV